MKEGETVGRKEEGGMRRKAGEIEAGAEAEIEEGIGVGVEKGGGTGVEIEKRGRRTAVRQAAAAAEIETGEEEADLLGGMTMTVKESITIKPGNDCLLLSSVIVTFSCVPSAW